MSSKQGVESTKVSRNWRYNVFMMSESDTPEATDLCLAAVMDLVWEEARRLATSPPGNPVARPMAKSRWITNAAGHYERVTGVEYVYAGSLDETSDVYGAALAAVKSDPNFGPACGRLVGSPTLGAGQFDPTMLLWFAVATMIRADGSIQVDEKRVREVLRKERAHVSGGYVESQLLAPLLGLGIDRDYELAPGIELVQFTQDEVATCASAQLINPISDTMQYIWPAACVGLRITVHHKVGIFEQSDPQLTPPAVSEPFGTLSPMRAGLIADEVLLLLQLYSRGDVSMTGTVEEHETALGGSGKSWSVHPNRRFYATELLNDELRGKLAADWVRLCEAVRRNKIPEITFRRFSSAMDRGAIDDQILDYAVAAEALLLKDLRERGELSYRFSLRGACLLEKSGMNRRDAFRFMKALYQVRSIIAHGNEPGQEIKISGREKLTLPGFLVEVRDIMRRLIDQAVKESADPAFLSAEYWDNLTLGPETEPLAPPSPAVTPER